jgi:hypothetical protein
MIPVREDTEVVIIYPYIYIIYTSGWWYTYPSEKYESQLGLFFPIDGKSHFNIPH